MLRKPYAVPRTSHLQIQARIHARTGVLALSHRAGWY